jgi:hypothetical protein
MLSIATLPRCSRHLHARTNKVHLKTPSLHLTCPPLAIFKRYAPKTSSRAIASGPARSGESLTILLLSSPRWHSSGGIPALYETLTETHQPQDYVGRYYAQDLRHLTVRPHADLSIYKRDSSLPPFVYPCLRPLPPQPHLARHLPLWLLERRK